MKIELSQLSIPELNQLVADIKAEIDSRRHSERLTIMREFQARAASIGMSLDEIISGRRTPTKRTGNYTVEAKYQDPSSGSTWTGRGKKPLWVVKAMSEGKALTDFLINK